MNKQELVWLAIGVFIGYLLWDWSQAKSKCTCGRNKSKTSTGNQSPQTFPPTCGGCGG